MAVTKEDRLGTMQEPKGNKPPEGEGRTPGTEKGVSPEQGERLYTQEQTDALIHATKSEAGRKLKDIEMERDNIKKESTTKDAQLADLQAERDSLQEKIEELSSDDPRKFDLIKRDKQLRDQQRNLNDKIRGLDERETKLAEREKKVIGFEKEVLIETIADEYENGDSAILGKAVSAFDNPTEEQIRTIAGILFTKAESEEGKKTTIPKVDSGRTKGSSTYFTRTQIADRDFWDKNKDAILEAQKEGRIRD